MQPMTSFGTGNNKRRFSDEQVKSLVYMFESEPRPELLMKQRLADELSLQPRQVDIWFQNKRARSKTKQIEHKYNKMKAEFETIASSYELMKREHQSLLVQLQKLKNLLGKRYEVTTEDSRNPNWRKRTQPNQKKVLAKFMSLLVMIRAKMLKSTIILEEHTKTSGNWSKFESVFVDGSSSTSPWWKLWS